MSSDGPRPDLPEAAAQIADLMERLIAVLDAETAAVGPGIATDNRALATSKTALTADLAARLPTLEDVFITDEAAHYLEDLDARLRASATANETALQAVLDSHARILRGLSEQASRRAGTVTYGPTGMLKDKPKPPGALPGGGKKI